MATSMTTEADRESKVISSFLPHACPKLSYPQVMSLRLCPTMYAGQLRHPFQILPVFQAAKAIFATSFSAPPTVAESSIWRKESCELASSIVLMATLRSIVKCS